MLAAARGLLDQHGYADVSIGQVAARAGVHRPAIYRRWPSKRHPVVDVVADVLGTEPTPDTGDLRADLTAALRAVVGALRDTSLHRVLPALVADLAADPELQRHFLNAVFEPRRDSTAAALTSARARQEIRPASTSISSSTRLPRRSTIAPCSATARSTTRWSSSRWTPCCGRSAPERPAPSWPGIRVVTLWGIVDGERPERECCDGKEVVRSERDSRSARWW
ncbi:putative transcriptional regulator [Nocardia farcinica IFM 10152]|uniref:Putative transcriptional regulator n=1 Tax=Nocardia farcinica (strain IFM 10152) TaxID=247156 RepID=Q5YTC7_NOCFA|nr:TetR/AcrR family transcriptional regulator [Nocardia farcinica]BAD58564.1 putative transcriptional regulator [Nocardia farcinica IFM 10152]